MITKILLCIFVLLFLGFYSYEMMISIKIKKEKGRGLFPTEDLPKNKRGVYRVKKLSKTQKRRKMFLLVVGFLSSLVALILTFYSHDLNQVWLNLYWVWYPSIWLPYYQTLEFCENGVVIEKLYDWKNIPKVTFQFIDVYNKYYTTIEQGEMAYIMYVYNQKGKKIKNHPFIVTVDQKRQIETILKDFSIETIEISEKN